MKTYAIGDIHGAYKALIQCFERSKFDYKNDRLIVMGDVCDGYPEAFRHWFGIEIFLIWLVKSSQI